MFRAVIEECYANTPKMKPAEGVLEDIKSTQNTLVDLFQGKSFDSPF